MNGEFSSADVGIRISDSDPLRVYCGSLNEGLSLTIDSSSLECETLNIAGKGQGTLTAMDQMGHRNPDPADTLEVDLKFDAAID